MVRIERSGVDMKPFVHQRISRSVCSAFCIAGTLSVCGAANAAEYGLGNYLLGLTIPMSGYTPPPGVYFQDSVYLYKGSAGSNVNFPLGRAVAAGIDEKFIVNIATLSWFAPGNFLGGTFGLAATIPYGKADVSADVASTGPFGINRQFGRSDSVTGIGDTAFSAILGWQEGNHHWNINVTGFTPTGSYNADRLANMGLNRPGVDVKGAYTWLDMQTGLEISGALGMTFSMENTATNYSTGNELHLEGAINQHFANGFSLGVGGYWYQQLGDDGGTGNRVGPFKGRVAALGPLIGYTFKAGEIPISLSGRWFHEFDTENRVSGDSVFATLSMPLFVYPPAKPAPKPGLITK
jgi:hypothetical protein